MFLCLPRPRKRGTLHGIRLLISLSAKFAQVPLNDAVGFRRKRLQIRIGASDRFFSEGSPISIVMSASSTSSHTRASARAIPSGPSATGHVMSIVCAEKIEEATWRSVASSRSNRIGVCIDS